MWSCIKGEYFLKTIIAGRYNKLLLKEFTNNVVVCASLGDSDFRDNFEKEYYHFKKIYFQNNEPYCYDLIIQEFTSYPLLLIVDNTVDINRLFAHLRKDDLFILEINYFKEFYKKNQKFKLVKTFSWNSETYFTCKIN